MLPVRADKAMSSCCAACTLGGNVCATATPLTPPATNDNLSSALGDGWACGPQLPPRLVLSKGESVIERGPSTAARSATERRSRARGAVTANPTGGRGRTAIGWCTCSWAEGAAACACGGGSDCHSEKPRDAKGDAVGASGSGSAACCAGGGKGSTGAGAPSATGAGSARATAIAGRACGGSGAPGGAGSSAPSGGSAPRHSGHMYNARCFVFGEAAAVAARARSDSNSRVSINGPLHARRAGARADAAATRGASRCSGRRTRPRARYSRAGGTLQARKCAGWRVRCAAVCVFVVCLPGPRPLVLSLAVGAIHTRQRAMPGPVTVKLNCTRWVDPASRHTHPHTQHTARRGTGPLPAR